MTSLIICLATLTTQAATTPIWHRIASSLTSRSTKGTPIEHGDGYGRANWETTHCCYGKRFFVKDHLQIQCTVEGKWDIGKCELLIAHNGLGDAKYLSRSFPLPFALPNVLTSCRY